MSKETTALIQKLKLEQWRLKYQVSTTVYPRIEPEDYDVLIEMLEECEALDKEDNAQRQRLGLCVKCASGDIHTKWFPKAGKYGREHYNSEVPTRECLWHHCRGCGYAWDTLPKDKEQRKDKP